MRIVIQRVNQSSVTIDGQTKSTIGKGFLILIGIGRDDTEEDIKWLVNKIIGLRIFDDEKGVMNRSIMDIDGEILVVSQFTQPPQLDPCSPARAVHTTLSPLLQHFERFLWQTCRNRRIRSRYADRTSKRWPRHHLYGHEEQGVKRTHL